MIGISTPGPTAPVQEETNTVSHGCVKKHSNQTGLEGEASPPILISWMMIKRKGSRTCRKMRRRKEEAKEKRWEIGR